MIMVVGPLFTLRFTLLPLQPQMVTGSAKLLPNFTRSPTTPTRCPGMPLRALMCTAFFLVRWLALHDMMCANDMPGEGLTWVET
jgi:hypothetical protein